MQRIFVHGLGQTPDCWKDVTARLDASSHSVCPDLAELFPGNPVTYQRLYQAFSEFCGGFHEELGLCGLSLGGVLALNYVIDHPQKVHSLVLIAAPYKMPKRLLQFQNLLFRMMPKRSFQQTGFGKEAFLQLCTSMEPLDFSNSLQAISCPALVICGEQDSANKKAAVELAGILKNAELRLIPGSGHEVNRDAPEALADCLADFYRRIPERLGER